MATALLAAVVIVKDEAAMLPACLESLAGVVDEVHVHDTGSADGTPELAVEYGATVTRGGWGDDFAAARNEARRGCPATWILALDADHRVMGDAGELRTLLAATTAEALLTEEENAQQASAHYRLEPRLYRPDTVLWTGRVYERLVHPDGTAPNQAAVPASALRLLHIGHATYADRIRRAERNLLLAQRSLDEFAAQGPAADREQVARTLLGFGRDCLAADQRPQAVETFQLLRALFPATPEWRQATDALTGLMVTACYDKLCQVLADLLRKAGDAGVR
ncbi:glycosyltransferase [Krasilnikovia sp. M28-CT-15]|uniref:glycosyltransferase n=1 Tax=Krasilnikovia sp. M28-CT-15 TaxID=3373540 RepID=UPI003877218E